MWMTSPVYSCGERTSTNAFEPDLTNPSTSSRKARIALFAGFARYDVFG